MAAVRDAPAVHTIGNLHGGPARVLAARVSDSDWFVLDAPHLYMRDGGPYEEAKVSLAPGDRIILYTDGLSEAMDARQEMYGDDRIADFAATLPKDLGARESIDAIMAGISTFLDGEEPQDDMTLMVLRVLGAPAAAAPRVAALPGVR